MNHSQIIAPAEVNATAVPPGQRLRQPSLAARLVCGVAVAVVSIVAGLVVGAAPAAAAEVSGCAQGYSEYRGTCIWVTTGNKNTRDHTQYVSTISVSLPKGANAGKLEAWAGDGPAGVAWYRTTTGSTVKWTVDKWIKNNSGICGAYSYSDGSRSIACITISA